MSVNKVFFVGNIGNDPETRTIDNGTKVSNFSLATSETYKDKNGEKKTETEWLNIVAWRHLAELAEKYFTKGQQLYIEGKIRTRQWETKEGEKRYKTEIIATTIQMLGKKSDDSQAPPIEDENPF